ncbi:hypothetical protein FDUTEX481_00899 [Tolypothrix sp. PCC 7601]|nr:hypothetical protein FDUTEX481_00899 [Tolypothrix sp. PCC 7601]
MKGKGKRAKDELIPFTFYPYPFPNCLETPLLVNALTLARDNKLKYGDRNRFWY